MQRPHHLLMEKWLTRARYKSKVKVNLTLENNPIMCLMIDNTSWNGSKANKIFILIDAFNRIFKF